MRRDASRTAAWLLSPLWLRGLGLGCSACMSVRRRGWWTRCSSLPGGVVCAASHVHDSEVFSDNHLHGCWRKSAGAGEWSTLYTASASGMLSHKGTGIDSLSQGQRGPGRWICVHVGQATSIGQGGLPAVAAPAARDGVVSKTSAGMYLQCVRWWRPRWPDGRAAIKESAARGGLTRTGDSEVRWEAS